MKSLIAVFLVFIQTSMFAQNLGSIQGQITDINTKAPLAFAKVFVEGTDKGAVTDLDGNYKIQLEVGTYTLRVSFVGYEAV